VFRKFGILLQHYAASQPKRTPTEYCCCCYTLYGLGPIPIYY